MLHYQLHFCCSLVGEYHDLYEMQRRRLEGQVATLTEERDLWSKVTYSLALKVTKYMGSFYVVLSYIFTEGHISPYIKM